MQSLQLCQVDAATELMLFSASLFCYLYLTIWSCILCVVSLMSEVAQPDVTDSQAEWPASQVADPAGQPPPHLPPAAELLGSQHGEERVAQSVERLSPVRAHRGTRPACLQVVVGLTRDDGEQQIQL